MLKRLLIFFVVHLLVITLVINTYSEASESPWDVRSMRNGQTILVLKTGNVTYGDTLMLFLKTKMVNVNRYKSHLHFIQLLKILKLKQ